MYTDARILKWETYRAEKAVELSSGQERGEEQGQGLELSGMHGE